MKVIIQIPCFNEEHTLSDALKLIPRKINGVDKVEVQIINDGCTDETVRVAQQAGVDYIVTVPGRNRRWLGRAFKPGIEHALKHGADIVVNTDGDNQYPAEKIPDLIKPIIEGKAQIVIGDRHPGHYKEFSFIKRCLQWFGNVVFKYLTRENVRDAVSGFRAYSKEALLQLNIVTHYTYTVDTLMQAYKKGLDVVWIDIKPNPKTRESRLINNIFSKVRKSGTAIFRMSTVYTPFKSFLAVAAVIFIPAIILLGRLAYFYFTDGGSGHVQSVVIGAILMVLSFQVLILGIIADMLSVNRILLEDPFKHIKEMELNLNKQDK